MADRSVFYEFEGRAEKLIKTLENIERHIRQVPENKTVRITAKVEKARREIEELEAQLEIMSEQETDLKVKADIKQLLAGMAKARAIVDTFPKEKVLTLKVRETQFSRLARVSGVVQKTIGGVADIVGDAEKAFKKATPATFRLAEGFQNASVALRRLGPLLTGVTIAIVASLIPALLALVPALAGAATGAGALAVSLGASLAPAMLAVTGIVGRLSSVMEVFQLRQQATDQALRSGAGAAGEAAQREQTLLGARRQLSDATRNVARAEETLEAARKQARADITAAEERMIEARRESAQAAQDLRAAEVQAYDDIAAAIERASDAARDLRSARLSAEEAELNTRQAELDLKKLRQELGATGKSFDDLFKKFSDVSVDTTDLDKAIRKAASAKGGGTSEEDQIRLEEAILRIRRAKLGEQEATDAVSDAEKEANDTQKEANRLKREGIAGVDSYKAALERNREAQRTLNAATKEFDRLERLGINRAPGVVAARQALADAQRAEARNADDLVSTRKRLNAEERGATGTMEEYRKKRAQLSDAERDFLDSVSATQAVWKELWKGAAAPVFSALTQISGMFRDILPKIAGPMQELVGIWANALVELAKVPNLAGNRLAFAGFFGTTKKLSEDLGKAFKGAFQALINVATAAQPFLEDFSSDFAKLFDGFGKNSNDVASLRKNIEPMVEAFRSFLDILGAIGEILINTFIAAADPINDFIDFIEEGLEGFADFLKSTKGKNEVKKFFEDVLPAMKSLVKFIVKFSVSLIKTMQFIAPILKPIIDLFSFFVDVLNFLLDILLKIPTPIRGLIGVFASLFIGLGPLGKLFQGLAKILNNFPATLKIVLTAAKSFGGKIIAPFRIAFRAIGDVFRAKGTKAIFKAALTALGKIAETAKNILFSPFAESWRLIKGAFALGKKAISFALNAVKDVFRAVLGKLQGFVDPFVKVAKKIKDGMRDMFEGLATFVRGVFERVLSIVKGAVNKLIDSVNFVIKAINSIPDVKTPFGKIGIPDIPTIPKLAKGGIAGNSGKGTLAVVGEAGSEAVLPLTRSVFNDLGEAITRAMRVQVQGRRVATAMAAGPGAQTTVVQKIEVKAPEGKLPDATATAVKMARILEQRGGGPRQ